MTGHEIICGDALVEVPRLVSRGVAADAVAADPPYGVNAVVRGKCFGSNNACERNTYKPVVNDDRPFDPRPLLSVAPVVCLWGANHFSHLLPKSAGWLIWDKRDGCNSNPLADCEMAWTNLDMPARLFSHRWMGMIRASEPERRLHPSQKPVALMRWTLEQLKLGAGATILDPYMGSGSLGVAALSMGMNYIGIDIDAEYCAVAEARLKRASGIPADIPRTLRPHKKGPQAPLFGAA